MQDLERQLDALYQLRSFLLQFMEELRINTQLYNNKVHGLREAGLPVQISDNYEVNYCEPNIQRLQYLVENMENVDLRFINENITQFEQALERARAIL